MVYKNKNLQKIKLFKIYTFAIKNVHIKLFFMRIRKTKIVFIGKINSLSKRSR